MFKRFFKKKTKTVNTNQIGIDLSESELETIHKLINKNSSERMKSIMILGDSGKSQYFYLLYYTILFDTDANVRFAALKRISKFKDHPNFQILLNKLDESNVGDNLEPYYSMMLLRIGKISEEDFNRRLK